MTGTSATHRDTVLDKRGSIDADRPNAQDPLTEGCLDAFQFAVDQLVARSLIDGVRAGTLPGIVTRPIEQVGDGKQKPLRPTR